MCVLFFLPHVIFYLFFFHSDFCSFTNFSFQFIFHLTQEYFPFLSFISPNSSCHVSILSFSLNLYPYQGSLFLWFSFASLSVFHNTKETGLISSEQGVVEEKGETNRLQIIVCEEISFERKRARISLMLCLSDRFVFRYVNASSPRPKNLHHWQTRQEGFRHLAGFRVKRWGRLTTISAFSIQRYC